MQPEHGIVTIAAMADIHCSKAASGPLAPVFAAACARADVLLLCGDLTDYGQPEEARNLVAELGSPRIPVVAVLGNHDFESGQEVEVKRILTAAGIHVLDGDGIEVCGVGFAGVKGFGGGFGRRTLEPWGEAATKAFVREAVEEALKLESALARLRTPQRVAVLHYSPIEGTVEGEPREIFPFLGSSRLEEPINRYRVAAAFHGHAHRGSLEGRTSTGIPVYNAAMPLLRRMKADDPPVVFVQLPVSEEAEMAEQVPQRRRDDRA